MMSYPMINPIAIQIGPFHIFWYGLMYLFSFIACWGMLRLRLTHSHFSRGVSVEQLSDIVFYVALGVIIGGRLGYMLFYARSSLMAHPLSLFQVWQGGMSFHGGLIGVILALYMYAKKINKSVVDLTDFIAPVVPIGLAAGRIGNFINGELWGRVTDVPWAMIFPRGGELPRHPSQIYEFLLEGVLLFSIVWLFSADYKPHWAVSGLFLVCYGLFRFGVEFFREPDWQAGFVAFGWLTKGQLLSLPMIIAGAIILIWVSFRNK